MKDHKSGSTPLLFLNVVAVRSWAVFRGLSVAWALKLSLMLLATSFLGLAGSAAVGSGVDAYTLTQAFADAVARDARVQAAKSRLQQARESREEVLNERWPTLSVTGNAGYSLNRNDARTIVTYEGQSVHGGLQLSQKLYTFGRLRGRLQRAEAEITEAEHLVREVRQDVLAEVARSFLEQVVYGQLLERRISFEMLVDDLKQVARERVELGTLDQTELYEIRRRLSQARAERIEAGAHARTSQMRLARLTGGHREALDAKSLAILVASVPASLDDVLMRVERESPLLAQARARAEAAEGELAFRKADLWPSLTLEVNAGTGRVVDIESYEVAGGVQLGMTLYEGGSKRSRLRGARSTVEIARQSLIAERELAEIQVRSSWEMIESLKRVKKDFETAIADAQTVVDLTRFKLDRGHATFVHYIEAQRSVLEAEFDQLDNRLALDASRIDLLRALAALR